MPIAYSKTWDGYAFKSHAVYATAHDAASATAVANLSDASILGQEYRASDSKFYVFRVGLYFDTSAWGTTPSLVVIRLTLYKQAACDTEFDITLVSGDDLGATGIVLADYGDLLNDTVALANVIDSSIVPVNASAVETGSFITVSLLLNTAGLAKVNPTGITQFALRSSRDINSLAPTALLPWERAEVCMVEIDVVNRRPLIHSGIYPTDPTTRVTSLIHRYDRGVYNLEMLFGEVTADFGIPNTDTIVKKAYEPKKAEPPLTPPSPPPPMLTPHQLDPEREIRILPPPPPLTPHQINPEREISDGVWVLNEFGGWEWTGSGAPNRPPPW